MNRHNFKKLIKKEIEKTWVDKTIFSINNENYTIESFSFLCGYKQKKQVTKKVLMVGLKRFSGGFGYVRFLDLLKCTIRKSKI